MDNVTASDQLFEAPMMDTVDFDHFLQKCMMTPIFITDEMFEHLVEQQRKTVEDVIDWSELPVNVIYQLKLISKNGNRNLLMLIDNQGLEIKVWSPANVTRELKTYTKTNNNTYIKSLGEMLGKTSSGRNKRYYDFEIASI